MSQSLYSRLARKYMPQEFLRRDVLKTSLAASAAMLLSNCGVSDPFQGPGGSKRRVVVVGGGFSGLACAYELKAAGYDVIVLEARGRVSGRVITFTDMVPGKFVEGGGELIGDDDVHSMWWTYANKFKLPMRKIEADKNLEDPIVFHGKKLSADEEQKIVGEMTDAQGSINEAAREINADQPWLSPNADEMDTQSMAGWLRSVKCSDLTKVAIQSQFEGNEGVAMDRMGYLPFLAMVKGAGIGTDKDGKEFFKYWNNAETYRCGAGNDALAKKFAHARRAREAEFARDRHSDGNQRVMVTTDDGHNYTAEDVVLTVPPSVWNKIHFTPNLPAGLKPQMGIAVKYLAGVKRPFWKDAGLSSYAATDGDISMTWEATENQEGPGAVLTNFSGGPAADRCRSRAPDDREAAYKSQIEQIYAGYAQNATNSRFMDWPADPWLMSTYSFGAPRQTKIIGPLLAEGMDTLHFAGEHTCWAFPGYMEGALRSGVMAARKLAKRDGLVTESA